jgi:hypothetical protein
MNQDIFFAAYILAKDGTEKHGMAVRIPAEKDGLPGQRIKALTDAVREINESRSCRLRTEILVSPPMELETRPLADFLFADGLFNASRFKRHLREFASKNSPHLFLPRPGVPVLGLDLVGREDTLQLLQNTIEQGRSCHLRAPRRYGKTSLLMRMAESLPRSVHIDLSDVGSLQGFLKGLLRGCIRQPDARVSLSAVGPYRNWSDDTAAFNSIFEELLKQRGSTLMPLLRETLRALADGRIVLLVDEFSIFLRAMLEKEVSEITSFLDMLHAIRTNAASPLVAVFAGSAGLSAYIEFHGMQEQFADLMPVDVPPIAAEKARLLAEELFYGMGKLPSLAATDRVTHLTGEDDSVPYFVHALAHVTAEETGLRREVREADVDRAYQDRLLGPAGNIFFRDFLLRELTYPPSYRNCASAVLKRLSRQFPSAVGDVELQGFCDAGCNYQKLMTCLEEDYDLVRVDDGWRMRSKVLADRWRLGEPWLTGGA